MKIGKKEMTKIEFLVNTIIYKKMKIAGGFQVILEVPESEYHKIKDLNDPENNERNFVVSIEEEV